MTPSTLHPPNAADVASNEAPSNAPPPRDKEKAVRAVFYLTVATMAAEIFIGYLASSMALVADGWHMASHASALLLAWGVERASRDPKIRARFSFDAGKLRALGGFTSALLLGGFALLMAMQCLGRFFAPTPIAYGPALFTAVVGLGVNGASFVMLRRAEPKARGADARAASDDDPNHRAAILHVLADFATSVLAVIALTVARYAEWPRLDPLIGLVGAALVGWWACRLVVSCTKTLTLPDPPSDS